MTDNRDPIRHFRMGDGPYEAAQRAVRKRGDRSVSHIIRVALTQYVRGEWLPPKSAVRNQNRGANREERDESP